MELINSDISLENNILAEKLLKDFEQNISIVTHFDLWYRISKFFKKNVDLLSYKNKKKDYIFYIDKYGVETHISVYRWYDKSDKSKWIIIEMIMSWKKDIMFFSEWKIYNIEENKWGWVTKSSIIDNEENILKTLEFIGLEVKYLSNKIFRYRSNLRERWVLGKYVSEIKIEKFKEEFKQNFIQLA